MASRTLWDHDHAGRLFRCERTYETHHISFPASVACLILLFFGLLLCGLVLGTHRTRLVANAIDVPAGWSLIWISVFFTTTFVLLPLSPPIGVVEVFKIIGVFVVGFVVMMVFTAYLTRFWQLLTGSSKRAHVERADELGDRSNNREEPLIPLIDSLPSTSFTTVPPHSEASNIALNTLKAPPPLHGSSSDINLLNQSQDPILPIRIPDTIAAPAIAFRNSFYRQVPIPPTRSTRWGTYIATNLDWLVYTTIGFLVGIPIYYATGYAMPLHTSITVLAYFIALRLPVSWRRFLHPVLVSAFLVVMVIWVLGLTRWSPLKTTLHEHRTRVKYLQLWSGDLLGTILDASIVSLALPMYQYRRELRSHFTAIIVPKVLLSISSLFAYPTLCFATGISAERSLAFAARSLTLALARPAMDNLGGDLNTVSAVAIMSGIIGALVGGRMLNMMRIPEDDYVTRGVTLGANSSGIATALLLQTDPRAAALSSLSMSLFAQPRDMVRGMVGL
ncbi:LrgB-like family-domain-containing protein [Apodospora peruviana]|uniref:LrgB-like family-domain-containing protein n=1 Tax=Apodospora peruviana TaxID=516989 RepID=A0AAE0ICQ7_9PEZI|nr:LrgB-like family-domain-containing protein [Apodospora peruviana]